MPENINRPELVSGRMPQAPDECVVDADMSKLPPLDSRLVVSGVNTHETADSLKTGVFKVVGTVNSPYYVNFERGTTSVGNGTVSGYIYVLPEAFNMRRYNELYIKFDQDHEIYSDKYNDYINDRRDKWEALTAEQARSSNNALMASMGLPAGDPPKTYILDRNTNIGYACFENDSEIVGQVARVFPIFFILVAALVCMTTMSRMVEEQRTQIGIFKALGYSDFSIIGRYLFYSGSAALLGCIIGYTIGIFLFPGVIWITYKMMYIRIPMRFVFDLKLAAIALGVSLLCSMGVTWLSCRYELSENSAGLMRPKSPKAGKRVLLERIPFLWNRLKFLHKVSLRNIFRYKKRFFMMITGISGCMALLLAGFGLKDSIAGFADDQYDEILVADSSIMFNSTDSGEIPDSIIAQLDNNADKYVFYRKSSWDILYGNKVKSIDLMIPESYEDIDSFMHFRSLSGDDIAPPGINEAIVSNSIMERYDADVGDEIMLRDSDLNELHLKVTGVFENHVYNYIFIAPETIAYQLGHPAVYNSAFINYPENSEI
ncbi:MAG: ABC transporter permease, partial [Ruminococcus sp.]|nr:ABC transporter permease [Ruminococcus sp.]